MYRAKAKEIPFTESAFISVSNAGLKISVQVDCEEDQHGTVYEAVCRLYEKFLGLETDKKCKDVCRLCYVSADANLYFNPNPSVFTPDDCLPEDPVAAPVLPTAPVLSTQANEEKGQVTYQPVPEKEKPTDQALPPDDLLYSPEHIACFVTRYEKRHSFLEGERNTSLFKMSFLASLFGIPANLLLAEAEKRYLSSTFGSAEITQTIRSTYQRNIAAFGSKKLDFARDCAIVPKVPLCRILTRTTTQNTDFEEGESLREKTPCFPENVYQGLPYILRETLTCTESKREKDSLLLATLATLGGCMSTVHGFYDRKKYYPFLYVFISAGAGQGKGIITYARRLTEQFENLISIESDREMKIYTQKMENWEAEAARSRKKHQPVNLETKPEEVRPKFLFLPTIISRAKLIGQLRDNGSMGGIMFDTEADSFTNANNADAGQFSEVVRRFFHHEKVTSLFKVDGNQPITIAHPKFSLIMSGTSSQLTALTPNSENGLYSRFLHYTFRTQPQWRDVSPQSEDEAQEKLFSQLSAWWCQEADFLRKKNLKVTLSPAEWKELNEFFSNILQEARLVENEDFQGVVKRYGLIFFRLCMIFTTLRLCDEHAEARQKKEAEKEEEEEKTDAENNPYSPGKEADKDECQRCCRPEDFQRVKEIISCCLKHSLLLMSTLKSTEPEKELKSPIRLHKLLEQMPAQFQVSDLYKLCEECDISKRTLYRFLQNVEGLLIRKVRKAQYIKIEHDSKKAQ